MGYGSGLVGFDEVLMKNFETNIVQLAGMGTMNFVLIAFGIMDVGSKPC